MSSLAKTRNPVIFKESFVVLSYEKEWTKILCARSNGSDWSDPYIFTPDGKKLRSSPELLTYISENSRYWELFDPKVINFKRNQAEGYGSGTTKLVNFLEDIRRGIPKEEALKSIKHSPVKQYFPRPETFEGFRRKSYIIKPSLKKKIGPKSAMKKWAQEGKINRKVLEVLEQHFISNKVKPQDSQMKKWANELKVPFEDVKEWFQLKWDGKLEYEWFQAEHKEKFGTSKMGTISPEHVRV